MRSLLSMVLAVCLSTGCATTRGPRDIEDLPPGRPTLSDWTRVRELAPPSEVTVSTKRYPASKRVFVSADDSHVVVLNVSSPALPAASVRVLREMAARYPDAFSPTHAGSLVQGDVRVGGDGVFVGNRKVAEFDEIVEAIARDDVIEIAGPVVARGSVAGAVLGGWLGFSVGVVPGLGGVEAGAAWLILAGSVGVGSYLGNRWSSHTTDGVIYRAP